MIGRILEFIYPRTCEVCGRPADRPGRHVCSACLMCFPVLPIKGVCRCCGRAAPGFDGEFLCEDCRREKPSFDRATSAVSYEGCGSDLMIAFKFHLKFHLLDDLVDLMEARVRAYFKVDEINAVVPMPATFTHRLLRGFNPAGYLAARLARRLAKPLENRLKRVGLPHRQGMLDEAARRKNVRDTFAVRWKFRDAPTERVLLVDDVMTTGATLSEAARMLKASGVKEVWAVSFARSVRV